MENDSGSEQSLSMNTARSEPPASDDPDAAADLTAEEIAEHQRREENVQAVERAAEQALAELEGMAAADRLSSQASVGNGDQDADVLEAANGSAEELDLKTELKPDPDSIKLLTERLDAFNAKYTKQEKVLEGIQVTQKKNEENLKALLQKLGNFIPSSGVRLESSPPCMGDASPDDTEAPSASLDQRSGRLISDRPIRLTRLLGQRPRIPPISKEAKKNPGAAIAWIASFCPSGWQFR